ncbi:MAG TPA: tRNA (adenosine(37)-N6)-threonylcarbamoyltransferase complex dimerization subunit type 1 TsaB, partial [Chitinophagaceae bacterium]|nr:tRNA (adenosine(37)-N6)-threonylcarbamoyltransferase complex dimerization subunit type 1 TsaB [Chitinophagaceae bacterium]
SYTGLRVGLSTAKGLCYALNIPLINISTLEIMAFAASKEETDLLCPVIDARRMEVFTAVYTKTLEKILNPQAVILNKDSFSRLLSTNKVLFFGNGSQKVQALISSSNAIFKPIVYSATDMISLSYNCFFRQNFADLAYTEPVYIKKFFSTGRKSPL